MLLASRRGCPAAKSEGAQGQVPRSQVSPLSTYYCTGGYGEAASIRTFVWACDKYLRIAEGGTQLRDTRLNNSSIPSIATQLLSLVATNAAQSTKCKLRREGQTQTPFNSSERQCCMCIALLQSLATTRQVVYSTTFHAYWGERTSTKSPQSQSSSPEARELPVFTL
jgi:hypothetical protein